MSLVKLQRAGRGACVALLAVVAACSGGDDSAGDPGSTSIGSGDVTSPTDPSVVTTADPPATTEAQAPDTESTSTVASTVATTTTTTTTTTEPPREVPPGERWTPVTVAAGLTGLGRPELSVAGEELWITSGRFNGSVAFRSDDAGVTWAPIDIEAPPQSGGSGLTGVVAGPNGRRLAWGTVGSDCGFNEPAPDGHRFIGACFALSPSVHISDDGVTWRRTQPAGLQAPGGSVAVVADMIATADGYAAIGTVRGNDWHARVWTSADGENWSVATELRGFEGPLSGRRLAVGADGSVVAIVAAHPCSVPSFNDRGAGWSLGTGWPSHDRIFEGTSFADLVQRAPGEHPLSPEPAAVDCSTQSSLELSSLPYPVLDLVGSGDSLAVVDLQPPSDEGLRRAPRIATLRDGGWVVDEIDALSDDDLSSTSDDGYRFIQDDSGDTRLTVVSAAGRPAFDIAVAPADSVGGDVVRSQQPLFASFVTDVGATGGAILAATTIDADPFDSSTGGPEPRDLIVWRSVVETGDIELSCVLEPGADCRGADLTTLADYPDFSDLDLTGIDLSFAEAGSASFDGADLSGATMWGFAGDLLDPPTFVDAVLVGAQVQDADLGSLDGADLTLAAGTGLTADSAVGANFTGANLETARIGDSSGAVFAGSMLRFAEFSFSTFPGPDTFAPGQLADAELVVLVPEGAAIAELSLAGWDLTDAQVSGSSFDGEQRVLITDLTGARLDDATFYSVDLSALVTVPDLSSVDVWDNSICPDGAPPDDPPIGTCVRGG